MDYINTVKHNKDGSYLINGHMYVPQVKDNRHYKDIQKWLALGNKVESFETKKEQTTREAKEADEVEWANYLEAEKVDKKVNWAKAKKPKFKVVL